MGSVWIIIAKSPIFVYLRDNAVPIRAKWGAEKMAMDAAGQKVQGAFGLRSSSIVMPALLICASLGTVVLSATTAVAQATSCQITTSSCPANPQYSGITWSDTYNGDNINQGACMARPASIYPWCGSPAGGNVTASFISGGTVVQTATAGTNQPTPPPTPTTSCQITTTSCPANPQYGAQTWSDTYGGDNANQNACMARPASIYSWCGSPTGGGVTASFISGGSVVQTASAGTTPNSPPTSPPSTTSCQITTSSCPTAPQYGGKTWSDTYGGDNADKAAVHGASCLHLFLVWHPKWRGRHSLIHFGRIGCSGDIRRNAPRAPLRRRPRHQIPPPLKTAVIISAFRCPPYSCLRTHWVTNSWGHLQVGPI